MPDPKEVRIRATGLQRRCVCCQERFRPHPRLRDRQKTCGKASCRKSHRAAFRREYRKKNPQAEQDIQKKRRESRSPEFWKNYRREHPLSTARNRANSRLRKQLAKVGLQRQLDIVQLVDPPGKLDTLMGFATSHRSLLCECLGRSAA
jgi:hypothetical protein